MSAWNDEMEKTRALIRANIKHIATSKKLIAEFRETMRKLRLDAQKRRDGLNPKIIRLPLHADKKKNHTRPKTPRARANQPIPPKQIRFGG